MDDGSDAARVVPNRAAPEAGQIIGERYRLEKLLERGAMGSIWRAEQITLRAPVVIKFLEPALLEFPEMAERFMQEARSAAAVRSVHVVQIFDYGTDGNVPFIAMEYLEGEDLHTRLSSKGTLTPAELNKVFGEVARGVSQAHALGVVHRDLKPGNIFLAREGEHEVTKVIDFGIAKVMADAVELSKNKATRVGTLLGTPQYMSPEQVRGSTLLDHRTDLWALAIIACECLTGRYPFSGTSIGDLTVQICTERPSAPSSLGQVPAGFDRWFFKATRKTAALRFASVEEMASALGRVLVSPEEHAPEPAWSKRLTMTARGIGSRVSHVSTLAAVFRARTLALIAAPSSRARPLASRKRWLVLALVMCGLGPLVLLRRHGTPRATQSKGPAALPVQAASSALLPAASPPPMTSEPTPSPGPSGPLAAVDAGAPSAAAAVAPAGPAMAPVRVARPRPKPAPPAREATPLGAMSIAMGRAGASILEGEGMRREARARAAAAAEARARDTRPAPPSPSIVRKLD